MDRFTVTTSRSGEWMNDKKEMKKRRRKAIRAHSSPSWRELRDVFDGFSKIIVKRVEAAAIWIEWADWKFYAIEKTFNFQLSLMHMLLSLGAKTSNLLRNPQSYKYCCKVPIIGWTR